MNISLKNGMILAVLLFTAFSVFLFFQHEFLVLEHPPSEEQNDKPGKSLLRTVSTTLPIQFSVSKPKFGELNPQLIITVDQLTQAPKHAMKSTTKERTNREQVSSEPQSSSGRILPQKGTLTCNGQSVDSEIIYWKIVPGDNTYESPITPHHGLHHDRYLSFEYDQGGWNNVRMGMECLIVVAHAMGRTLVVPPQQHLYLLGKTHKDEHDAEAHDEMGFEDFFDLELLRSHRGFHVQHMEDFLATEAVTGGLHGVLPPGNSSDAWGPKLWAYLAKVCVHCLPLCVRLCAHARFFMVRPGGRRDAGVDGAIRGLPRQTWAL